MKNKKSLYIEGNKLLNKWIEEDKKEIENIMNRIKTWKEIIKSFENEIKK